MFFKIIACCGLIPLLAWCLVSAYGVTLTVLGYKSFTLDDMFVLLVACVLWWLATWVAVHLLKIIFPEQAKHWE